MIKNDPTFWKKIMKFTFFSIALTLSLGGSLLANPVSGQGLKQQVSVQLSQQDAASAVEQLRSASGLSFYYEPLYLKGIKIHGHNFNKAQVSTVLHYIIPEGSLTFEEKGGVIIIRPATAAEKAKRASPGKITGKVVDEKGQILPGASIRIIETGARTQSDMDGNYRLEAQPGIYTMEISFISYQTQKVTGVAVNEGKPTTLDVAMYPSDNALKEVVVTSSYKNASVAGLYARQKSNAAMTDGISAAQIARTPDKNVGETLKRISGVAVMDNKFVVVRGLSERYNGAMLNGQQLPSTELNRKQFAFDIVPSKMVDNVVVYKTITPDQSAEFGGGLVQVNTKEIPTENFTSITFGESLNDKTYHKNFRALKIGSSQYFAIIPENRLIAGRSDWKSRAEILASPTFTQPGDSRGAMKAFAPADIPNNWALHNYRPGLSPNAQFTMGRVFDFAGGQHIGFIASASYRNNWQIQDVLSGRDGFITDNEENAKESLFSGKRYGFTTNLGGLAGVGYSNSRTKLSYQAFYLRTLDQQDIIGIGQKDDFGYAMGYYDLFTQTTMLQQQLKGEQRLNNKGLRLNYGLSYLTLDRQKPDNHFLFASYNGAGEDHPMSSNDFSIGPQTMGALLTSPTRTWSRAHEKQLGWNADIILPFNVKLSKFTLVNALKMGYAGWRKDRSLFVLNTSAEGFASQTSAPLSTAFDQYLHPAGYIAGSIYGDDYPAPGKSGVANLHAGYLMMDNRLGKFRFVWGARAEYYNLNNVNGVLQSLISLANANQPDDKKKDFSAILNQEKNWKFFPSAGLTYSINQQMNFRFAYARSIIRPDLRELAVFKEYDYELGGEYRSGSPLHSTILNNFDLRYEWFPTPGEVFSLSVFYKKLDYPMEIYRVSNNREFELRNNRDAKNKGLEVDFRKSFAFTNLPVIKNITLFGNATILTSKVRAMEFRTKPDPENPLKVVTDEQVGPEEKRPQTGASNLTVNTGASYDDQLFSLNISYNYISNRMFRPNVIYQLSLYEQPAKTLDGQLSFYLLKRKLELRLSVSNLLDSYSVVYFNDQSTDKTPTTKDLLYKKGVSSVDYLLRPGRTYSAGINYNF